MPVWSNLDFEYSLIHGDSWTPPGRMLGQMEKWERILRLIPGQESASISAPTDAQAPLCWGVDARAHRHWPGHPWPGLEVVKWLNDKRTSAAFNQAHGLALPGETALHSLEEVQEHIRAFSKYPWVLKHPFGVSGRGLRFGPAGAMTAHDLSWARNQLALGHGLVWEPRVGQLTEYSLHVDIGPEKIVYRGMCGILSDTDGTHRGHRIGPDDGHHGELADRWFRRLAPLYREAQERGYTGPLGTDGYIGLLGGQRWERPLSEVNARHTFGRLALCLGRWRPGLGYSWIHPRASEAVEVAGLLELSQTPLGAMGRFRLPEWADAGGGSGTFVEVG